MKNIRKVIFSALGVISMMGFGTAFAGYWDVDHIQDNSFIDGTYTVYCKDGTVESYVGSSYTYQSGDICNKWSSKDYDDAGKWGGYSRHHHGYHHGYHKSKMYDEGPYYY